jgi:hypothetical protein
VKVRWSHRWLGSCTLKERFNRLFSVTVNKNALVSDILCCEGGKWNHCWQRRLCAWEEAQLMELEEMLAGLSVRPGSVGKCVWRCDIALEGDEGQCNAYKKLWKCQHQRSLLFMDGEFFSIELRRRNICMRKELLTQIAFYVCFVCLILRVAIMYYSPVRLRMVCGHLSIGGLALKAHLRKQQRCNMVGCLWGVGGIRLGI